MVYYTEENQGAVYTDVSSRAIGTGYKKACVQQPYISRLMRALWVSHIELAISSFAEISGKIDA